MAVPVGIKAEMQAQIKTCRIYRGCPSFLVIKKIKENWREEERLDNAEGFVIK